jgi:uncharacterized membrane protein YtjA (UPF0391 family)
VAPAAEREEAPQRYRGNDHCICVRLVESSEEDNQGDIGMLKFAVIFFVVALIAALFGFGGIAAGAASIAKILFFGFLIIAAIMLVVGLTTGKRLA